MPDDEWIGELHVSASSDGFSGESVAWFDLESLRAFATELLAFPLRKDAPPSITGGHGGNADTAAQTMVGLTIEPHNLVGAVRATIHLETEVVYDGASELAKRSIIRFALTYGDLSSFARALIDHLDGRVGDAVLQTVD